MKHSIALVTGATSGVGHAAARLLAAEGYREIFVTGRTLLGIKQTAVELAAETDKHLFTPLQLDLDATFSAQPAVAELVKRGQPIDFLVLIGGKARVISPTGVEAAQAPLIGHHELTVGLLRANLLSPNARIVIAGAEHARGDVPMFSYTGVVALAARYFRGDRSAAVESLLRSGPNVKYEPNREYADAKLTVTWWAAALARQLPPGMAVYAVSPGAAIASKVVRNVVPALKYLMIPIVSLIPGMNQTGDGGQPKPPGVGVRNRRLRTILCLAAQESHGPDRGAAPATSSRPRQKKPRGMPSSGSPIWTFPIMRPWPRCSEVPRCVTLAGNCAVRGRPASAQVFAVDRVLLLKPGITDGRARVHGGGHRGAHAPLSGYHHPTVGLLHSANNHYLRIEHKDKK